MVTVSGSTLVGLATLTGEFLYPLNRYWPGAPFEIRLNQAEPTPAEP